MKGGSTLKGGFWVGMEGAEEAETCPQHQRPTIDTWGSDQSSISHQELELELMDG
jgi:hypothetical protein